MVGNQPLFGAAVHEVGINVEGEMKEKLRARDIGASKGDIVDAGQLLGQAAQLATTMKNAEITSEANNAKQDYLELTMSEAYRDGDSMVRAGMLENIYGTLHEKPKAYQDAFTSYSSSTYKKEYDARGEMEDNSFYNAAPAAFKVHEMETGEGATEFVDAYAQANPRLDKNVIKTSLLEGAYQEMFTEVSAATNEKELSEALENVRDIKQPYQNPKFLQTKSKKGRELVTAAESQLNTLIKAKEAEFVTMHKSNIDSAVDSKYSVHPARLEEDFDAAYKDPITRGNKKREYSEKYQESTEAHSFNATFPLGSNPGKYPNDMAKEYRQLAVTDELTRLFSEDSVTEFVRIADNETKLTKETGDMLVAQMNKSTDPAELASIFNTINKINVQPKGPGVLRQMLSDEEYTRVMKTQYVSTYRPDYSPQQARDYVDGTQRNIARSSMTKKKMIERDEYAVALGKQGQKFLGVMQSLIDTDPQMAEDLMKDVAKFFDGQMGESTTGKPTDNSMGSVPESIEPERTDKMIDEALPNTSSLAYVDNMIIGYDDIGGVVKIINSEGLIKRSDSNAEDKAIREQIATKEGVKVSPKVGAGVATEAFSRTVVDNLGRFVTGVIPTFKELGSNIAGAIGENIMRNLKEDIKNSPEFVQDAAGFVGKILDIEIDNPKQAEQILDDGFDEFYLESLKEQSENLDTRIPEVQNNTLTPDVQASLAYALANNKVQKQIVDTKIEEIEDDMLFKEAVSSGAVDGKPTEPLANEKEVEAIPNRAAETFKKELSPIADPIEMAQFKAQVQHESGGKAKSESGYYSTPDRIVQVFGTKRLQGRSPKELTKNTEKLLNVVYGGDWGKKNLGNIEEGDGYKYRGRGYIQITGRANYKKFGDMIGVDLVNNPDKALEPEIADKIALAYWNTVVKPKVNDFNDTKRVTRLINGGYNGLNHRESLFNKYKK